MVKHIEPKKFSDELESWLQSKQPKTLLSLIKFSEEKSFAVLLLLLMFLPALPLPTGGITHVFEVIAVLIAIEMMLGLKSIWLPKMASKIKLGETFQGKVIPAMMKRIRWLEKHSRPRASWIFSTTLTRRLIGLASLIFIITAAVSPPLSGLDTLPALGVVAMSLAIILDDAMVLIAGFFIGTLGVTVSVVLGSFIVNTIKHFV